MHIKNKNIQSSNVLGLIVSFTIAYNDELLHIVANAPFYDLTCLAIS